MFEGPRSGGPAKPPHAPGRHHATTCDVELGQDEAEFSMAMDRYKRETGKPFPTWSEALYVLTHELGYRRMPGA